MRFDKTDRAEVVNQQSAARKLGFGSCSKTEAVKDYEAMMAAGKVAGWRERSLMNDCMNFIDYQSKALANLEASEKRLQNH